MGLQIGQALGRGTRRTLSASGVVLVVSMLLYQFAMVGAVNTLVANSLPPEVASEASAAGGIGVTFPVSTPVAAAITAIAVLFGAAVFFVATRLLARELSSLGSVPLSLVSRRFGWAFLSTLAVSLVLSIVIPIGLVMLLVPGIFLAVSFQFAIFAVGVEDCGPIAALKRSWELATGNRWRLFGLLLLVFVIGAVAGGVGTVVSLVDPTAAQYVSILINSVLIVVTYGILADAFVQLGGGSTASAAGTPAL
ncbi:MAG: hypothetical protein R6V31_11260 [Halohasta sp.]